MTFSISEAQPLTWGLRLFMPLATEYDSNGAWRRALSTQGPTALRLERYAERQGQEPLRPVRSYRIQGEDRFLPGAFCIVCRQPLGSRCRALTVVGHVVHLSCLPTSSIPEYVIDDLLSFSEERFQRRTASQVLNGDGREV